MIRDTDLDFLPIPDLGSKRHRIRIPDADPQYWMTKMMSNVGCSKSIKIISKQFKKQRTEKDDERMKRLTMD